MTAKLDLFAAAPAPMKSWMSASRAIVESLEPGLVELVEIRASQINGCANCLNMHTASAREKGESEQAHLPALSLARGALLHERERAALGWTDALTRLSEAHHHETAYEAPAGAVQRGGAGEATLVIKRHQRLETASRFGFGLWVEPEDARRRRKRPDDDETGMADAAASFDRAAPPARPVPPHARPRSPMRKVWWQEAFSAG